jgi:beta-barrel assembly-enhancing protease
MSPHLSRRAWLAGSVAILTTAVVVRPAGAQNVLNRARSMLPTGGFSVDGRRGAFLQQVTGRPAPQGLASGPGGGLTGDVMNRGDAQTARLRLKTVEDLLTGMLTELDRQWPNERPQQPRIILTGLNSYSAKAVADGSIIVNYGLLLQAQSDDELAFVLAHELGHVRLGHYLRDESFIRQRQMASRAAQLYLASTAISEQRVVSRGDKLQVITEDQKRIDTAARQASANNHRAHLLLNVLAEPMWARGQEDESDALGYDISKGCGYSAFSAALDVFTKISADFELRKAAAEAAQNQVRDLTTQLLDEKQGVFSGQGGVAVNKIKSDMSRGARDRAFTVLGGFFSQRHRTPEARLEGVTKYATAAYGEAPSLSTKKQVVLNRLRALPEYKDGKVVAEAVAAAQAASCDGDFPKALAAIRPALEVRTVALRNAPFVANAAADLFDGQGDSARAEQLYTTAHRSADQTIDGYLMHVEMLVRLRRYDRARQVINEAVARYGDEKPFLAKLIAIDFRTGKNEAAIANLKKCSAYEEPALKTDCTMAVLNERDLERYNNLPPDTRAKMDGEISKLSTSTSVVPNLQNLFSGMQGLLPRD